MNTASRAAGMIPEWQGRALAQTRGTRMHARELRTPSSGRAHWPVTALPAYVLVARASAPPQLRRRWAAALTPALVACAWGHGLALAARPHLCAHLWTTRHSGRRGYRTVIFGRAPLRERTRERGRTRTALPLRQSPAFGRNPPRAAGDARTSQCAAIARQSRVSLALASPAGS